MSNLAEQKKFTYKDYSRWTGDIRYELIDGTAYAMASPSQAHQVISRELSGRLWQFLRGKTCKMYNTFAVRLNFGSLDDTVVEPDILVVCDKSKLDGKSVKGAPDLIIEILPPYNTRRDTVTKARWYRKAGVKEYWIVDPNAKTVQTCILENGKYIIHDYNDDDIISVYVLKGCEINMSEVFYDTIEIENDSESETRDKIIRALKASGVAMSDEQIAKAVKILDSGAGTQNPLYF